MANTDTPNGFTPVGHLLGLPWSGKGRRYSIAAAYGTALYIGDLVALAGSADADGIPTIQAAAVGTKIVGSIIAVEYAPNDLSKLYSPATTVGYAIVADDPFIIFEAQEDDDSTALTADEVGNNADFISTHSGNTTTGRGGMEIDAGTVGTGSDVGLKLLGLAQKANNAFGAYAKWLCTINEHYYKAPTGGV